MRHIGIRREVAEVDALYRPVPRLRAVESLQAGFGCP
jgi:hypothetical protein